MDYFDFYAIEARAARKSDLTKAGIPADRIRSERTWATYGRRSYPRYTYVASVSFVDDVRDQGKVDEAIRAAQALLPNASIRAAYHARD